MHMHLVQNMQCIQCTWTREAKTYHLGPNVSATALKAVNVARIDVICSSLSRKNPGEDFVMIYWWWSTWSKLWSSKSSIRKSLHQLKPELDQCVIIRQDIVVTIFLSVARMTSHQAWQHCVLPQGDLDMFKMVMMIIVIVFCRMMMINITKTSNRKAENLFKLFGEKKKQRTCSNNFQRTCSNWAGKPSPPSAWREATWPRNISMIRIVEIILIIRIFVLSRAKN